MLGITRWQYCLISRVFHNRCWFPEYCSQCVWTAIPICTSSLKLLLPHLIGVSRSSTKCLIFLAQINNPQSSLRFRVRCFWNEVTQGKEREKPKARLFHASAPEPACSPRVLQAGRVCRNAYAQLLLQPWVPALKGATRAGSGIWNLPPPSQQPFPWSLQSCMALGEGFCAFSC